MISLFQFGVRIAELKASASGHSVLFRAAQIKAQAAMFDISSGYRQVSEAIISDLQSFVEKTSASRISSTAFAESRLEAAAGAQFQIFRVPASAFFKQDAKTIVVEHDNSVFLNIGPDIVVEGRRVNRMRLFEANSASFSFFRQTLRLAGLRQPAK